MVELSIYDDSGKFYGWWVDLCEVVEDTIHKNNSNPFTLSSIRDGLLDEFNARYLFCEKIVVFDSEEDKLVFLLKWS